MGSVHSFTGDERDHCQLLQKKDQGEDWTRDLGADRGHADAGRLLSALPDRDRHAAAKAGGPSICGRSSSATSRRSTRRGCRSSGSASTSAWAPPEQALAHRDYWLKRGEEMLPRRPGRRSRCVANDPFFGRGGRMMAATQKEQDLKYELVVPVATAEKPTAVASCNYHLDHFGHAFGIQTADGKPAHTRLRRLRPGADRPGAVPTHGFDPDRWPARRQAGAGPMMQQILPLDPADYQRHPIHGEDRDLGRDELLRRCLGRAAARLGLRAGRRPAVHLAIDFEGDQWTFFKFPHADLYELYGLDVQELAIWRPLVEPRRGAGRAGPAGAGGAGFVFTCRTPPARPIGAST